MGLYDPGDAPDPTEQARRELIPRMPAELAAARVRGEPVWTADEMARDFEALGFMAPFVVVRRLADNVRGTLMFTDHPRYYFGWEPETLAPTPASTPNAVSGLRIPRRPLFQLGQLVATPGAIEAMRRWERVWRNRGEFEISSARKRIVADARVWSRMTAAN